MAAAGILTRDSYTWLIRRWPKWYRRGALCAVGALEKVSSVGAKVMASEPPKRHMGGFQQNRLVEATISEGWSTGEGCRLSEQRDRRVPEIKETMTSDSPTRSILGNFFTSRSFRRFFFNKIGLILGILTREVPRTRVDGQNRLWLHWLLSQMRPKKL